MFAELYMATLEHYFHCLNWRDLLMLRLRTSGEHSNLNSWQWRLQLFEKNQPSGAELILKISKELKEQTKHFEPKQFLGYVT